MKRVNVVGVIASILLLYVAFSNKPWWILIGGSLEEHTYLVEVSPFIFHVEILERPMTIPIIPYLNLAAKLSILLAAITTFIGSLLATKRWSRPMISVKGLIIPITFMLSILIGLQVAKTMGIDIPITGEFIMKYTVRSGGLEIATETPSRSIITSEYWIALTAGVTSAIAKIIQNRMASRT